MDVIIRTQKSLQPLDARQIRTMSRITGVDVTADQQNIAFFKKWARAVATYPAHRIGLRPTSSALSTLALTSSFDSPKTCRRSE